MVKFHRLDIVMVKLDPTVGSEVKKTRPCVIISPNIINHNAKTILVAAITEYKDEKAESPLFVPVLPNGSTGLKKKSLVTLMQVRTIDKLRIVEKLGKFPRQDESSLAYAIKIGTGLERV